jgi:hypothetical protein
MKLRGLNFKYLLGFLFLTARVFGVTPMVEYNDLVAGQGDSGFRDGTFVSALFHSPSGLVVNQDASKLFVADTANNRIRVIQLDNNNNVQTLAGVGQAGMKDGPLLQATFNQPSLLTFLAPDKLLVYEKGNHCFRLLNLAQNSTALLSMKLVNGEKVNSIEDVAGMAFMPDENSVYFTQPTIHSVSRFNLSTGVLIPGLIQGISQPFAICRYRDHLCVGDYLSGSVFQVEFNSNTQTTSASLTDIGLGLGTEVASLETMGNILYGISLKKGLVQISPAEGAGPVKLMSGNGNFIMNGIDNFLTDLLSSSDLTPTLVSDPQDEKRFFLSLPNKNLIISVRDYRFEKYENLLDEEPWNFLTANGITDFDYPTGKPPKTFRILLVGASQLSQVPPEDVAAMKMSPRPLDRMDTIPKKLELILNSVAALSDEPVHFQVLTLSHSGSSDFILPTWPYAYVPKLMETYDVDLCFVLMTSANLTYQAYHFTPSKLDGTPGSELSELDDEFLLKSTGEKMSQSKMLEYFGKLMKKHSWGEDQPLEKLLGDPDLREVLVEMLGRPYQMMVEKIKSDEKAQSKKRSFYVCFLPMGSVGGGVDGANEAQRDFWKDVCEQKGLGFLDLTDPFNALKMSFYPVSEDIWAFHLLHDGHTLVAGVLADELIRQKLIPLNITFGNR